MAVAEADPSGDAPMDQTRRQRRASRMSHRRRRRLIRTIVTAAAVVLAVIAGVTVVPPLLARTGAPADTAPAAATPSPTPLSAADQLLSTTDDPAACAVSFTGEGITVPPALQAQGELFSQLPIPHRDGWVFAGWYPDAADAAALSTTARVNGGDLVACTDRRMTLVGGWIAPEQVAADDVAVPILMYHQFTTDPAGEGGWLSANYLYTGDFAAQMAYLSDQRFYLPTWDELAAFIDGRLWLPHRSVIVTDDDADASWLQLAVPIVDQHGILTSSFVITKWRSEPTPSRFVLQRSHTHDMHESGADGRGRMVNATADEVAADLETSAGILGAKEVVAYPFGHYNDIAKAGVAQAGFELARTTEQGYVRQGADKLALPCIRINAGTAMSEFIAAVG